MICGQLVCDWSSTFDPLDYIKFSRELDALPGR